MIQSRHALFSNAALLFIWTVSPVVAANSINWTSPIAIASPAQRTQSAMAYDSVHHQLVMFGGSNNGTPLSDTWLWDGTAWTQANPAANPPARTGHSLAYDSARGQVVMFGGFTADSVSLGDTWVWDGANWTQKAPATSPSVRGGHAMAFDAAHSQVVLFGGSSSGLGLADTWTWDGTNWSQQAPATSPTARDSFGLVYDSAHSQVVLFGGKQSSQTSLNDTWVWSGSTWTQLTPVTSPPKSDCFGMVFDATNSMIVLFGGENSAASGTTLGDTWFFDNSTWTKFAAATNPSARIYPAMGYDSLHSQTVLFSGQKSDSTTAVLSTLAITLTSLPNATQTANYSIPLAASGGLPPYNFSVSGLPPGLSVSPQNVIVGQCLGESPTGVTIQVTDSSSPVPSTANVGPLALHCNPAPLIVTPSQLTGIVNVPYSVSFATNAIYDPPGAAPYTWSFGSTVLAANNSPVLVLSGISTTADTYTFSITFTDRWGATTTKAFEITFSTTLAISTLSLPSGAAGTAYSQSLQAVNSNGGLSWSVMGGSLPPGLTLSTAGVLAGLPAQTGDYSFTVQVKDSTGLTANQMYSVYIAGPSQPAPTITATLSATVNAGDQPIISIVLSNPYQLPITVTATLQISPSYGSVTDLLFANGSRTTQIVIPANTTQAQLPFQAGTLAGTIQITLGLQAGGADITPNPAPSATTQVAAAAPVIKSVTSSAINGGFQLTITGASTPHDMKSAAFHFTAAGGSTLQLTDATLDISNIFTQWYQNASSLPTGSQFSMNLPVLVTGDVATIASVSVVMTNSVGSSSSASVTPAH